MVLSEWSDAMQASGNFQAFFQLNMVMWTFSAPFCYLNLCDNNKKGWLQTFLDFLYICVMGVLTCLLTLFLANSLLKDEWPCVRTLCSPGVCFLAVSQPRGEYAWKPLSWSSSNVVAQLPPTNCLVPTVLPAFTVSEKSPCSASSISQWPCQRASDE